MREFDIIRESKLGPVVTEHSHFAGRRPWTFCVSVMNREPLPVMRMGSPARVWWIEAPYLGPNMLWGSRRGFSHVAKASALADGILRISHLGDIKVRGVGKKPYEVREVIYLALS